MANLSGPSNSGRIFLPSKSCFLVALALAAPALACGQAPATTPTYLASAESSSLPDAPIPANPDHAAASSEASSMATHFAVTIDPGQSAERLRPGDKILMGFRASVSPFAALGWVASAGYEQARDTSPNYGQTTRGFAQRLGASAARNASQDIFTDSVLAPALREDSRYYRLGDGHSFLARTAYALTRPLITRTDGGRETLNIAMIGGNLSGAALTQAYYPPVNRGLDETMKTFGGSMAGSAVGFLVREFFGGTLHALHTERDQ